MGNIVLLDELTINQIAAGEVIERPASVVKELVENSIDAGADKITVEIKNGGISYIKITDNGKGIAKDDLEIAFERHATSKIRSANDLSTVTSMGFRGEALASIAAISKVEMTSKTEDEQTGYKIIVEGGDILEKEEVGCQKGTSIVVNNLFYNTPVRYKFLKKDYTESGYIEDVITRIALVNPNISIKLINSGKTIIQTNGRGELKDVIYSIYGKDIASSIMPVSYQYEDIYVTGAIGKPEIARSNRSQQLFFVNKRYVKDKTLSMATEQAYKGLIPIGKFGFVIINLQINPSKMDVNVHPAKLEVRFQEENKVFQSIYHAIKDTLLKSELVADTQLNRREESFEERLKNIQQGKKENQSGGLFSFRKQNDKQIEKYTQEESEIKTNQVIENNEDEKDSKKLQAGEPVDTFDVLQQLKRMKEKMEREMQEKVSVAPSMLKEESEDYHLDETSGPKEIVANKVLEEDKQSEAQTEKEDEKEAKIETQKEDEIKAEAEKQIEEEAEKQIEEEAEKPIEKETEKETEKEDETQVQKEFEEIKQKIEELEENPQVVTEDFNEMYAKLFGRAPIIDTPEEDEEKQKEIANDIIKNNLSIFQEVEEVQKVPYKFIGIVFKTYIILEIDNEMYILDQHAAHERIMYEKVKKNYYKEKNKDSQLLLLPDIITLTHKEMEIARDNIKMFEQAGFMLEEFGENTIKLTGAPTICIDLDTKELFLETLDEINTVARTAKQEKEEKFIATVACKAAVKANMALDEKEVKSLMDKLLSLPNPFTCPHGRPTAIKMTKYDIERKFARK